MKIPKLKTTNAKKITNPSEILQTIANHFRSKFKNESNKDIYIIISRNNSARYRSGARCPWGRRTVVRWASNSPCKNKSATETSTNTPSQQALDKTPATRAAMPSMKVKGQSRMEAFDPTRSMTSPRHQVRSDAWHAQTIYETGKTAQVISEMQKYRLNILGISEVRWNGASKYVAPTREVIYYSPRDDGLHREGVALVFDRETNKNLMEWEPINHRTIRARLYSRFAKLTTVQCYAPTEAAADDEKDKFYSKLQEILSYIPKHNITVVMGDLNA
ncbi:craniofacial development protein 2-like [Elysia marginata]|uniref:Craniofacial development protein 2-like n=1 Tax=Elysia marginata TaxID=1093978 RepID=A0AAV4FPU4_9GAST|nr:craniofacial development protein 2-like [Elysia marginata]